MLKSRTHAKYRPQPVLLAALLVGLLLSLQTSAADTARQGTQSTALYLAVRNILSTGTTVTGEPIRYPSGAPALLTAVEIAEGSWGTTNTSLTTMARLRLCRTATEQAFQRGTLEDSSPAKQRACSGAGSTLPPGTLLQVA